MKAQSWQTKSSSGGGIYTTQLASDGKLLCNCKGWTVKKGDRPRECKHTKKFVKDHGLATYKSGEFLFVGDLSDGPIDTTDELDVRSADDTDSPALGPRAPEPMLASPMLSPLKGKAFDEAFDFGWAMEEKLDGHRCIVVKNGGITAWSRPRAGEKAKPRVLPQRVIEALGSLSNGIYDGELVVPGGKSWDVTRLGSEVVLVLFDILAVNHIDLTGRIYEERRMRLMTELAKLSPNQQAVSTVQSLKPSWKRVEAIWKRGGEGAILKRSQGKYHPGERSSVWVKVKPLFSVPLTVTGFVAGKLGPYATVALREAQTGVETTVKTLDQATMRQIAAKPESFIGRTLWIEHQGKTPDGKFRHPMFDHFD